MGRREVPDADDVASGRKPLELLTRVRLAEIVMEDSAETAHRDFGRRLVGGLSWSAGAQLGSQAVTFGAGVLLARLLSPSDFGVVAMAMVYTTFVWLLGQTGFSAAIVYTDELSEADLCTVYWTNLGFNLVLFAAAVALSPLVGRFFRNPEVVPVIAVASFGLVMSALGGVQRALLEKRLRFRGLARNQFVASIVYAAVAVVMALAGFGVWALVVGRLLEQATESTLSVFAAHWRPRRIFSRSSLQRLMGYGGRVWAGNMLYYGQENIDNIVVGRLLGTSQLGYYALAFRLANVPRWLFTGLVGRVVFPSFASSKRQPELLRRAFVSISAYSVLIALGLGTGMALVAHEFVGVVYGAKWLPSVPPLQILAIAAGVYCVGQVTGPVLLALGKPGLQTKLVFGSASVLLVGAIVGVRWGIAGVAASVFLAATVSFILGQTFVMRTLGVATGEYMRAVAGPLAGILGMTVVVLCWRWLGQSVLGIGDAIWLVAAIALGAVGLVVGLAAAKAPQLGDILAILGRARGRTTPGAMSQNAQVSEGPEV